MIDKDLYIELLQDKVRTLQKHVEMERMARQLDLERSRTGRIARQGASIAGMMGVTPSQAAEAMAEAELNFKPPRNLGDGPVEGNLIDKTRADLAQEDDGC